ncbi:MAG: hypothetical protein KAU26_04825 [Methylococcales bacterium]|nr:hypothetical protein [Methylococcales bacterium]
MFELLKFFYELALFKKSPEDIPTSSFLQLAVIFSYIVISFLMFFMSSSWTQALLHIAVEMILIALFCRIVLSWHKKLARYSQTFIALLGVDVVISLCAFPAVASLNTPMPEKSSFYLVVVLVYILLVLWHWLAAGHIFRKSLSESFIFGLGISLLYLMLSYLINTAFFA